MSDGARISRRELLASAGAGAALGALGCDPHMPRAGLLGATEALNQRVQQRLFRSGKRARLVPARELTPVDDFPRYFISPTVPVAPAGWELVVGGMVRQPMRLSLDDLKRMTRAEVRVRHHCVEGWTAVASWQGVAVAEIAARAGADPRARFVEFRSFDGDYWSSWDRESALHAQTILAYGMNGNALAPGHGAPLRLYAAVKLGYKMVKYLTAVSFLPEATGGYWENQGYEWYAGV
jgi:DMSO/TMAO reductase YedYZ molybdopterin-dependent catalytic subunit